jgi:hypothetical protein
LKFKSNALTLRMYPWAFQTERQLSLVVSKLRGTLRFNLESHESPCELFPSPCEEEFPFTCELPLFAEARKQIVKMRNVTYAFISLSLDYACVFIKAFMRFVKLLWVCIVIWFIKRKRSNYYKLNNGIGGRGSLSILINYDYIIVFD